MSTDGCCTFGDLSPGWYTVGPGAMPGMFFTTARHAEVEVFAGKVERVSFGSRQLRILLLPVIIKNGA
jgi:hypothetical protein